MALTFEALVRMDLVQKHVNESLEWLKGEFADNLGSHISCRTRYGAFDSPLEAVFDIWWMVMLAAERIYPTVERDPQQEVIACGNRYRLDFRLVPDYDRMTTLDNCGLTWPKIAVELDGHDFHERTREQVIGRNQRDRDLQADGWLVLHYSGSELNADPSTCVLDAWTKANNSILGIERLMWKATAERAAANQVGTLTTQES